MFEAVMVARWLSCHAPPPPPDANNRVQHIFGPSQSQVASPMNPFWSRAKVDFLSDFFARRTNQGPRDEQWPARRIMVLRDEPGTCKTNQGLAGCIRDKWDGSGPRGTNQGYLGRIKAPRDESGPRRTNQFPAGRIRVLRDR